MHLPFSTDEFFGVFAQYNRQLWPVVVAIWVATLLLLVLAWEQPLAWNSTLSSGLAVLWLWNAVAYHAFLFTTINPGAWLFSALFAVQAVLHLRSWRRDEIAYFRSAGATLSIGVGLIAYALLYPFLAMSVVHRYPATPTFGVPCPTVILTIGALLTARRPRPVGLAIIPIIWSVIGGSAAMLFGVATDYVLLAAGLLLVVVLAAQQFER